MTNARTVALVAVTLLGIGGCSTSSPGVVRPPAGDGSNAAAPASSPTTSSASSASARSARPAIRVVPATGLHNRETVRVLGSGFTAGEALQVVQCASLGKATGPGDCNLSAMEAATSDAGGRVTATLTVVRGPFGAAHVVCSGHTHCLISITEASLQPTEEADAPITFA